LLALASLPSCSFVQLNDRSRIGLDIYRRLRHVEQTNDICVLEEAGRLLLLQMMGDPQLRAAVPGLQKAATTYGPRPEVEAYAPLSSTKQKHVDTALSQENAALIPLVSSHPASCDGPMRQQVLSSTHLDYADGIEPQNLARCAYLSPYPPKTATSPTPTTSGPVLNAHNINGGSNFIATTATTGGNVSNSIVISVSREVTATYPERMTASVELESKANVNSRRNVFGPFVDRESA
jgi:hypothetical protein